MEANTGIPTRKQCAVAAFVIVAVGSVLFGGTRTYKGGDNAYMFLYAGSFIFVWTAIPFALAALLPYGAFRQRILQVAYKFFWVLGGLAAVLVAPWAVLEIVLMVWTTVAAMLSITLQGIQAPTVPLHFVATVVLFGTLYLVGNRFARDLRNTPPSKRDV